MWDNEEQCTMPPPAEAAQTVEGSADAETPELVELRKQLEDVRAQAKDSLDKYLRTGADFANYRKRQERDREQQELDLRKRVMGRLLPIAEDFRRALTNVPPDAAGSQWVQGVALIASKIETLFGEFSVKPMEALGKPFDPAYHQALMQEPSDKYPAGTVIEELEKGYMIGSQVLKAALVKVSSGPAAAQDQPKPQQ